VSVEATNNHQELLANSHSFNSLLKTPM